MNIEDNNHYLAEVENANLHPFAKFVQGEHLNLSCQNLSDKDIPRIVRFLQEHPIVRTIDLSLNNIGDQGISDFVERNQTILQANFSGNTISDRGLALFAYLNQIITHVNFTHNLISENGINLFARKNQVCYVTHFSTMNYH